MLSMLFYLSSSWFICPFWVFFLNINDKMLCELVSYFKCLCFFDTRRLFVLLFFCHSSPFENVKHMISLLYIDFPQHRPLIWEERQKRTWNRWIKMSHKSRYHLIRRKVSGTREMETWKRNGKKKMSLFQPDFITELKSEIVASIHGFLQPTSGCWNRLDADQRKKQLSWKMDQI